MTLLRFALLIIAIVLFVVSTLTWPHADRAMKAGLAFFAAAFLVPAEV